MKLTKLLALFLGLSTLTAACAAAVGDVQLEGLQALTGQGSSERGAPASEPAQAGSGQAEVLATAPLRLLELADEAERAAPFLDIVQIEVDAQSNLVVFAIFTLPASSNDPQGEALFEKSVEAIWGAAVSATPEVQNITVAFMRVLPVNTLDRGLAPAGWLIGGITVRIDAANEYISGKVDEETRAEFWGNGRVQAVTLDQAYAGTPNHPLRSLEG